jgi:linker between RRM2 and RRM3 domains in RBM39 protein
MAIATGGSMGIRGSGNQAESLDEGGESRLLLGSLAVTQHITGGNLNAVSRQALMQKLARVPDTQIVLPVSAYVSPLHALLFRTLIILSSPKIDIKSQETRCILLTNAFDPAECVSVLSVSDRLLTANQGNRT